MTDMRIATTDGAGKVLEDATVQGFRAELRGSLLAPDDASYDETRKVWNGMIDRRPALIARCGGVADVIAAVRFSRTHGLLVSVRGGGPATMFGGSAAAQRLRRAAGVGSGLGRAAPRRRLPP